MIFFFLFVLIQLLCSVPIVYAQSSNSRFLNPELLGIAEKSNSYTVESAATASQGFLTGSTSIASNYLSTMSLDLPDIVQDFQEEKYSNAAIRTILSGLKPGTSIIAGIGCAGSATLFGAASLAVHAGMTCSMTTYAAIDWYTTYYFQELDAN